MISITITERGTKMQAKIRWPKIGLFLVTLLFLSAIPLTVDALEIRFCVPFCGTGGDASPTIRGPGTPSTVSGVTTTRVTIASFVKGPFTISGTVTSQQSGTLQKITFNPTAITANAGSGCNTTATNPCRLEIIATSHFNDFPLNKPTGGYPAGVFMTGYFTGTEPAHVSPPNPNGDTISMTAEASGLAQAAGTTPTVITDTHALNKDVINATPGAGTGDVLVSLPSSCTGTSTCKFTATAAVKSFNTQIQETVQQRCDTGLTSCRTRLRTRVSVAIKTAGNRVNLPGGVVTVDPEPGVNQAALLIAETLPPFENLNVEYLRVSNNDTNFRIKGTFALDLGNSINPPAEEVYLRIGSSFAMTIPVGNFKSSSQGRRFTFSGTLDGQIIDASFDRGSNPALWQFTMSASRVKLTGLPQPPNEVSVELAVGSDRGSDLVTASISK